jgi:hypothetical protein
MRNLKGQFTEEVKGKNNPKWKGNKVGYFALHTWVQREKGQAKICVDCGSSKTVQWANISKEYKRDLVDWKSLCQVCHRRFDGITKLSKEQGKFIRELYSSGVKSVVLAKRFNIHQSNISRLINNKVKYHK